MLRDDVAWTPIPSRDALALKIYVPTVTYGYMTAAPGTMEIPALRIRVQMWRPLSLSLCRRRKKIIGKPGALIMANLQRRARSGKATIDRWPSRSGFVAKTKMCYFV